jgi:hypothetical protein
MPSDDLHRRATVVREDALRHLVQLAGDASMCAIGRSGRSFPAAKYHEGRQSAAAQLARRLGRGGDSSAALAEVREQWSAAHDAAQHRGPDWLAYAEGGLDALSEITEADRTASPTS